MYAGNGDSYLVSPITTRTSPGCLQYSVHSRGSGIGILHVSRVVVPANIKHASNVDIGGATYTSVPLDALDVWNTKRLDLQAATFVVIFRSRSSGNAVPGYISIDDIVLMEGNCASQSTGKQQFIMYSSVHCHLH
jgi:hypothetical protein